MQELTDGGEEQVRIYAQLQPNANVVFRGEDIAAGAPIAAAGTVLTPAHIGVLAGQGIPDAEVFRPLTVGVLATGSELLEAGEAWAPGKIYDANGIQNAARLRQLGFAVERTHCSDDPEEIAARMKELLTRCDAVITSGGVSVGQKDYLPTVLEMLHAEPVFAGVAQKPGSPMIAAQVGEKAGRSACPAIPLPLLPRWSICRSGPAAGRRAAGRELHPGAHPGQADHRLFQAQQGDPLSAGQSAGRLGGDPWRGQRGGAFLGQSVGHDGLQLPGGAACGQRPGGSGRRSGGTELCTVKRNRRLLPS